MSPNHTVPSRRRAAAAYTLVEVMLAVGVMALAITTAITTMQRAFLNLESARNIETACRIIQCEMEKERLMAWDDVQNSSYQPTIDTSFTSNPAVAGVFSLSRSVSVIANHSNNMIRITVTATWRNSNGRTQSRSQSTYFGKNGLYSYISNPTG